MRVLYVIPAVAPIYGGPSLCVPALASAVAQTGVSLHMVTTNANGGDVLDVPLGVPVEENGFTIRYFPRQRPRGYTFSWPMTSWLWRNVCGYDLVHIHSVFNYPSCVASRIARHARVPYVVTPHGMLEPWAFGRKAWKKRPYFWAIEKRTLAGAAALHALADDEGERMRGYKFRVPEFVLPNGIHVPEFSRLPGRNVFEESWPQVRGKRIVLFLGRIDPQKGPDILIRSFAALLKRDPEVNAHVILAGPDLAGFRKTLEALVREEGIGEYVTFTGVLFGDEKRAALGAADIFVLPSRSEGFSIAVLEAMAAGLPVIITESCNFPRVAEVGAGRVAALSPVDISRAIGALLEKEETRRSMGERGRALVTKEYSWPTIADRMIEFYRGIIPEQ